MRRVDRPARGTPSPRFEIDRRWLWRGALAVAVIAFLAIFVKTSMMAFGGGNRRLERNEAARTSPPAEKPAVAPQRSSP